MNKVPEHNASVGIDKQDIPRGDVCPWNSNSTDRGHDNGEARPWDDPMDIGPKPGDRVTVNGQQGEVATRWPGWMSVELDDGSIIKVVLTRIQND